MSVAALLNCPSSQDPDERKRVRQAAAADTSMARLVELAADPRVTVRAALVMNAALPLHVTQLLAGDTDERIRCLIARKLAAMAPALSDGQRDELGEQALATLSGLVEDTTARVREAIADVLKDMPAAPRALILRLARDAEVSVFEPLIRLSPMLTEADLLALVRKPPVAQTVAAVAGRPALPAAVCDAIAKHGDEEAITRLLENPSAAIREATLDSLIAQASTREAWHAPLVRRPRLSPRATFALSSFVAASLLEELALRADLAPDVTAELRGRLARRLNAADQPHEARLTPEPDIETAMSIARALYTQDRLDEETLLGAIERGEARMATALLAVAAGVPASVVDRAATLRSAKGLVSLVWKAGFTMRVATPLQPMLARTAPGAGLRPGPRGAFPLSIEEMRWQIDFLGRMGR